MNLSKNTIYKMMQPVYWMAYCCCGSFISFYLVSQGFSNATVGLVSAVSGILAALGQSLMGVLSDNPKIGWKWPTLVNLALVIAASVFMYVLTGGGANPVMCLVYGFIIMVMGMGIPLLSMAAMVFPGEVNFGSARAIGSMGYALMSFIMGGLCSLLGARAIPIGLISCGLLAIVVTLPMPNGSRGEDRSRRRERADAGESRGFLARYPVFTFLWVMLIIMLTSHAMANTFLLQILQKAGGDSRELGIAAAIAAIMEAPTTFFYVRINKYISARVLFIVAGATYLLRSIIQLLTGNIWVLYGVQLLQLTSWGIICGAGVYYANDTIPDKDKGKGQAMVANALTMGQVFGALLGGYLLDKYDVNMMLAGQIVTAAISTIGLVFWVLHFGEETLEPGKRA